MVSTGRPASTGHAKKTHVDEECEEESTYEIYPLL